MTVDAPVVLVVDDEDLNFMVVEGLLEGFTPNVVWADSGFEALRYVKDHHVDVILMDGHMPVMDGATTTARVLELKPEIKVIAMTADAALYPAMTAAGCVGFLVKPISFRMLFNAINGALGPSFLPDATPEEAS